LTKTF